MGSKVVALLCSDIHLTEKPPVSRSVEDDWLLAQSRILSQLSDLVDRFECPVLCAGDVFDNYRVSPYLLNWAIGAVPHLVSIMGQHDLPFHNLEDRIKSGYWTLVLSGVISDVGEGRCMSARWVGDGFLQVWGFPWGSEVKPLPEGERGRGLNVALVHSYVWVPGSCYPGAYEGGRADEFMKRCEGYDVVVTGDNHIRFMQEYGGRVLYNCGCLIPRRIDEKPRVPAVGLLYEDGKVEPHLLDVSEDKWLDQEEAEKLEMRSGKLEEFLRELRCTDVGHFDFCSELMRYVNNPDNRVDSRTREVLLEVLEGERDDRS